MAEKKKKEHKDKGTYIKKKKDMYFQSVESMQLVVNVVNEAAAALNDKNRIYQRERETKSVSRSIGRWNWYCGAVCCG